MAHERVLEKGSKERFNLCIAADFAMAFSPKHYKYVVRETYLDYGQDWKWTTLIANPDGEWGGYQALNPREWDLIVNADDSVDGLEQIETVIRGMFADKYCPDREGR